MRMSAIVPLVCGTLAYPGPAPEKPEPSRDTVLARCTKILQFGEVVEFVKPGKADAIVALGLLGDKRAVPVLLEHLKNEENGNLRYQIVRALGWLKSKEAVRPLEKLLEDKRTDLATLNLRRITKYALEDITGKNYGAKESEEKAAERIVDSLRKFGSLNPGVEALAAGGIGEVGKTYRFVFTRPEMKDVVAELLETPRPGWAKVRVLHGERATESWINLSAVAMVVPVAEKKSAP
jgi:hypothetical protein